jgi:hypothetical protein
MIRREEAARLAAIRQSHLERARIELEAQERLEILEKHHEHERRLAVIGQRTRERRDTVLMLGSCGVTCVTVIAALAFFFGKIQPQQRRMQESHDRIVAVTEKQAEYGKELARKAAAHNRALVRENRRLKRKLAEAGARPLDADVDDSAATTEAGTNSEGRPSDRTP